MNLGADLQYTRINDLIEAKRFVEARDALTKTLPNPYSIALLYKLGVSLLEAGDFQTAEKTFVLCLRASPLSWQAAYSLGLSLQLQKQSGGAFAAFTLALTLNPDSVEVRQRLDQLLDL